MYFASTHVVPSSERRLVSQTFLPIQIYVTSLSQFISDTSVIFAAFRNLMDAAHDKSTEWYLISSLLGLWS